LLLSVRLSVSPSVAYIANNSRTRRPSVLKFRTKVLHLRCDSYTSFKVKRSKVKVARSRDQSEQSWPNAVSVSLAAGGTYRVGRTRRPLFLFYLVQDQQLHVARSGANRIYSKRSKIRGKLMYLLCPAICRYSRSVFLQRLIYIDTAVWFSSANLSFL